MRASIVIDMQKSALDELNKMKKSGELGLEDVELLG